MAKGRITQLGLLAAAVLAGAAPAPASVTRNLNSCPALLAADAALRDRYAKLGSHWLMIDCEPIHYIDEGRGPAVLLIHGSYASARQWDGWAAALSRYKRVIRFDLPPAGLSGPNPVNDYSTARKIRIIDALLKHLHVRRVLIVGTSSGGVPAAAFAAERPDKVTGLILNNVAVGPIKRNRTGITDELKSLLAEDARHPEYHTPALWGAVLRMNFFAPEQLDPKLAEEWTDLNNRMLQMNGASGAQVADGDFGRMLTDLPRIKAPTLFLWSAEDREVSLGEHGQRGLELSGAQNKQLVVIPRCGHMMPLECPAEGLVLAIAFIRRVAH